MKDKEKINNQMKACQILNAISLMISHSALHCGKVGPYSTSAVLRASSSGLEGFGNFGSLHYRSKMGGHLPYEGLTAPGLVCLNLDT